MVLAPKGLMVWARAWTTCGRVQTQRPPLPKLMFNYACHRVDYDRFSLQCRPQPAPRAAV